jgi:catechol 2,3-dioxygenase-like lactoylglutathione lyase family enzyme
LTSIDTSAILDASTEIDANRRVTMSRIQLALNVSDIDEAVEFYAKLFGTEPAKRQPGYANFAIADPPLKLVLMEDPTGRGHGMLGALNHLGVEVETTDEVAAATGRLSATGIETEVQVQTTCCYAVQDKVWVNDPDGAAWEVYTVLADAPAETGIAGDATCCVPDTGVDEPVRAGATQTGSSCC